MADALAACSEGLTLMRQVRHDWYKDLPYLKNQRSDKDVQSINRRPMTSRDLAKLIGVSQSAVSRAFTPGASISPDMRARILHAADDLGYQPNAIASILSTRRSKIVGLVISDLRNPFYPVLLERLTRALQERGQQTLLFNLTPGSDIKQQLTALRVYNVDALIIISATVLSGADLSWATEGRKSVLVNRVVVDANLNSVICDDAAGARAVADHFHSSGFRRVAYVAGLGSTTVGLTRREAFETRIAELGLTLTAAVTGGEYSYEAGYRAALKILQGERPEAIFFANDILAIGGIDALRDEAGLRVPEDVAVAGFDDIAMASWPRYQLTTYRQPVDSIVRATVDLVDGSDKDPGSDREQALPRVQSFLGEIVPRATTAVTRNAGKRSSA
jgi:DNA-binding LacI/PurR family transcriptional regulator